MEPVPVFRAAKRRKFTRPHEDSPVESSQQSLVAEGSDLKQPGGESEDDDQDAPDTAISNLIRARKNIRRPATGVQFSTTRPTRENGDADSGAVLRPDENVENALDFGNRFVGSTGQVVNVDQHMVAFIDSEIARRRQATASNTNAVHNHDEATAAEQSTTRSEAAASADPKASSTKTNSTATRQLAEVDLGTSAHALNLARTQAALERVKAGKAPLEDEVPAPRPRKPRLGRDGKPMRPRPKKRRNSEDVARDSLIEQFLHENKIDLYDMGTASNNPVAATAAAADATMAGSGAGDRDAAAATAAVEEGDTDERFAEQFRQDFIDAMSQRKNKNRAVAQAKAGAKPTESRGPKLGGSRAARAKMIQMQKQGQSGSAAGKK